MTSSSQPVTQSTKMGMTQTNQNRQGRRMIAPAKKQRLVRREGSAVSQTRPCPTQTSPQANGLLSGTFAFSLMLQRYHGTEFNSETPKGPRRKTASIPLMHLLSAVFTP